MEGSDYIGLLRRMTERIMSKAIHPFHYFLLTFHYYNSLYEKELHGKVKRVKRFSAFFDNKDYLTNNLVCCAMKLLLNGLVQPIVVYLLISVNEELN